MRQLAQSSFRLVETRARVEELQHADEMVVCNALMPVVPVRAWGTKRFSSRALYEFLAPLCEHPN